jgi:hypothetical protein
MEYVKDKNKSGDVRKKLMLRYREKRQVNKSN